MGVRITCLLAAVSSWSAGLRLRDGDVGAPLAARAPYGSKACPGSSGDVERCNVDIGGGAVERTTVAVATCRGGSGGVRAGAPRSGAAAVAMRAPYGSSAWSWFGCGGAIRAGAPSDDAGAVAMCAPYGSLVRSGAVPLHGPFPFAGPAFCGSICVPHRLQTGGLSA